MDYRIIEEYISRVQAVYATGVTTEHSFRAALGFLFDAIDPNVRSINEPKQLTDIGRPDFVFQRSVGSDLITLGHCEAKDINKDVDPRAMRKDNKNQFERYVQGLPNLIYTNGLEFYFYKNGEQHGDSVRIADFAIGINPLPRRYPVLVEALKTFAAERLQTITSAKRLASLMAGKAKLIKTVMFESIQQDKHVDSGLVGQYKAFKEQLIHDLSPEGFADIYAETVVYGMFAARLKDKTKETFSRPEALELLPKSNPFLRDLFSYVAGPNLDERIRRDIDELAEIFVHVDPDVLFADFGHFTKRNDPFIHFYEDFLKEYNNKKKVERGVWYTPEPVVNFIVRAVDDVLKSEFGLRDGLADTSKISVTRSRGQAGLTKAGKIRKDNKEDTFTEMVHRVQILDPATGTGTFLAETIKLIGERVKESQPGNWSSYVEKDLIPRVHGFELLMAPYTMCHMKLDMMLSDMGYVPTKHQKRLSVYLTNSLEEGEKATYDLPFANFLSKEANAANEVKREKPIMCIIGNPPYSGVSANKGDTFGLLNEIHKDYKMEPGGKVKLEERRHWLDDDYVKFIRKSEFMIEKNSEGVLAFITNHGYLSNPTFRGMRWKLQDTFDKIYIIDLHGNSNRKEKTPDDTVDDNVFDISVGCALIVAIKKKDFSDQCTIYHRDVWGKREQKYSLLRQHTINSLQMTALEMHPKFWMFYPIDSTLLDQYSEAFSIEKLFTVSQKGIITARDHFAIDMNKTKLESRLKVFSDICIADNEIRTKYFNHKSDKKYLKGDTRSWSINLVRQNLFDKKEDFQISKIFYRPFDQRWVTMSESFNDWPRTEFMKHISQRGNFGLSFNRNIEGSRQFSDALVFSEIVQHHSLSNKEANDFAPLYLYPEPDAMDQTRRVNMDLKIRAKIKEAAIDTNHAAPDEVAIFDYIYGVLHCPAYRETYAEFLKIDFPRVPYPSSPAAFWDISAKGTELRKLHLMEPDAVGDTPYPFHGEGIPVVEKPNYIPVTDTHGHVAISKDHYFDNIPKIAWEFYIGGYQPAQKWLKDRKGAVYNDGQGLDYNDIRHYQSIIKILSETDRIMKTIEMDLG